LSVFDINMITLPRQARDKQRENSEKSTVFFRPPSLPLSLLDTQQQEEEGEGEGEARRSQRANVETNKPRL
jgi:hypothetical protein